MKKNFYFILMSMLVACGGGHSNDSQEISVDYSGTWTTELSQRGELMLKRNYDLHQQGSNLSLSSCLSSPTTLIYKDPLYTGESAADGPYWWIGTPSSYSLEFQSETDSTLKILSNGENYNLKLTKTDFPLMTYGNVNIEKIANDQTFELINSEKGCSEAYFGGNSTIHTEDEVFNFVNDFIIAIGDEYDKSWNLVLKFGENGQIEEKVYDFTNDLVSIEYVEIGENTEHKYSSVGSECGDAEIIINEILDNHISGSFIANINCEESLSGNFDLPLY